MRLNRPKERITKGRKAIMKKSFWVLLAATLSGGALIIGCDNGGECKHEAFTKIPGVSATCTEVGLSEGTRCTDCGEIIVAQKEIPALGHKNVSYDGKEPTCLFGGFADYEVCEVCGYSTYEDLSPKGHTMGTVIETAGATEARRGYSLYTCSDCGYIHCMDVDYSNYEKMTFSKTNNCTMDTTAFASSKYTFEAVLRLSPAYSGRGGVLFGNYGAEGNVFNVEIYYDGKFRLYSEYENGAMDVVFDYDVRSDRIINIALTVDGTEANLYVDAVLVETKTLPAPLHSTTSAFALGGDYRDGNTNYYKGEMYSATVYADVRSLEELRADLIYYDKGDDALLYAFNNVFLSEAEVEVSNVEDLQYYAALGVKSIRIVSDIVIDRTIYVVGDTTIYANQSRKLIRASHFGGDMFVVGEDVLGRNLILHDKKAVLRLGGYSDAETTLTIDGNRENMLVPVTGTVFFICYSGKVELECDLAIVNCYKNGNEKTFEENYYLSYSEKIGGAVAIISDGTLNIYGGIYENNGVLSETDGNEDSIQGGLFYNKSNVNIYGGVYKNNTAGRGTVIYNYKMARIFAGSFEDNQASTYGGVIAQANSEYAELYIGEENDITNGEVRFERNIADASGGAIFSANKCSVMIYGNTFFVENVALNNGGAINVSGALTIAQATFTGNVAGSKGGAIHSYYAKEELTTRFVDINHATFLENKAERGGALSLFADDTDFVNGTIVTINSSIFEENRSVMVAGAETNEANGGAIYVTRKSTLFVRDTKFNENVSACEGGAIYATDESVVVIEDSDFVGNSTSSVEDGNGGAISLHSVYLTVTGGEFLRNESAKHGAAIYLSYKSSCEMNSVVDISETRFEENASGYHGGAIYVTSPETYDGMLELSVSNATFTKNTAANNGGAIYVGKSDVYIKGGTFNESVANSTEYGGGAIYASGSKLEIDGTQFLKNTSAYNAGGIALYSGSELLANKLIANENYCESYGGFLNSNKSHMDVYNSKFIGNKAEKSGGAISYYTSATGSVYGSQFISNQAVSNGGAIYHYSGEKALVTNTSFTENSAEGYGGVVYVSKEGELTFENCEMFDNTAGSGGLLYITTGGTTVVFNGITVRNNTADKGNVVYGNAAKAVVQVNKSLYQDEDTSVDDSYWSSFITNKGTLEEITSAPTGYEDYVEKTQPEESKLQVEHDVDVVLNLAKGASQEKINDIYGAFPKLDGASNFMSRQTTYFDEINGGTVSVDSFSYQPNNPANNPSVGEGILIYQTIMYKLKHPTEKVKLTLSSFRLSVAAAVCIDRNSRYFGYMRNLYGKEYDDYGFVRVAYLLVCAASVGVDVTVIGQIDGYPASSNDLKLKDYFTNKLSDFCDIDYVDNGTLGDYLKYYNCDWTAYDENSATDMMHTKTCTSSHYLDKDGQTHRNAVWISCMNLDGITDKGLNGNNGIQTAVLISGHEKIYTVTYNYVNIIAQYCGQERVIEFRERIIQTTKKQMDLFNEGRGELVPAEEQIVYLGTESDDVFELYFTPLGGDTFVWDTTYNPYCKYIDLLRKSDSYITFAWSNPKCSNDSQFYQAIEDSVAKAFHDNANIDNKLYLLMLGFDGAYKFNDLVVGETIGYMSIGKAAYGEPHNKDMLLSYSINGKRKYVSLLNSLNLHGGAMHYQSNSIIVIKEDVCDENSVFFTMANTTTKGLVN